MIRAHLAYFPVTYAYSSIELNRADYFNLFGKNDDGLAMSLRVAAAGKTLEMKVVSADRNELHLTASDGALLGIDPMTIVKGAEADFLKISVTLEAQGKELPFTGRIMLIPRRLLLNSRDASQNHLLSGQMVYVASRSVRTTIFGDVWIGETSGMSRCLLSRSEAEGALLKENDLIYLANPGVAASAASLANKLPERFVALEFKPGRRGVAWITEKDVWQAIVKKKKIWVPKNTKMTPAARDLGMSRQIFEFEL